MSMSMYVVGIPSRDYFDKMMNIKSKCEELNIDPPDEVKKFFGKDWEESGSYLEDEILFCDLPYKEYKGDMEEGFEINVNDIPENIKIIRFYCSW